MNDSMTDEQFAKWLQDEEFRQQREASSQNEQRLVAERADAEYARRLASDEEQQGRRQQQQQNFPPGQGLENTIALQHGQTIAVRLQHPSTRNQIDEALYAHHVDRNVMMFEMVRKRGTYLRVKDSSETEFSTIVDDSSQFCIENTAGGMLYLGPRKHNQKVNLSGGVGWMLALSHVGALIGNSSRNEMAQWRLLAAPDAPPYTPLSNSSRGGSGTALGGAAGGRGPVPVPSHSSAQSRHVVEDGSGVSNPLAASSTPETTHSAVHNDSRRAALVKSQEEWLDSAVGQTWLSQEREGRSELRLLHKQGKLRLLLHRPDWPTAALRWKDYATLHSQYLSREFLIEDDISVNFQEFFEKGYTVCPGAISDRGVTTSALKAVNYWLGQYPNHPAITPEGTIDLSGEILRDQSLLALIYETPLIQTMKGFFKENIVIKPCLECQVSLRFPDYCASLDGSPGFGGKRWHIDKFGLNTKEIFSILVGVPLSSTTGGDEGNLCVFPGRQTAVFEACAGACRAGAGTPGAAMRTSLSDVMDTSKPDFGEPDELRLQVGDVVFMSQYTPRRSGPNYSAHTNYMVRIVCNQQVCWLMLNDSQQHSVVSRACIVAVVWNAFIAVDFHAAILKYHIIATYFDSCLFACAFMSGVLPSGSGGWQQLREPSIVERIFDFLFQIETKLLYIPSNDPQ